MRRISVCAVALASAALALSALAGSDAWRRIEYPDFVKRMPQMKGAMLGSTTEKEFRDLSAMGATLVRYQMHADWKRFGGTNEVERYVAWLNERLANLERMMEWGRKYNIKICVDLHTHLGGFTKEKYSSDMMFAEKKYEDIFVATWKKIARRVKGNTDVIYGYDLFNEPIDRENNLTRTTWRAVMCRAIETVRKIDSVTPIVVEPNCHASPRGFDVKNIYGLKGFEPLPYDNLIYSVHVYTPMDYTHQGLFQKKEDYKPRPYPGRGRLRDPNRKRYAGDLGDEDESKDVWDKDFLRREIQSVRDFQLATGARIFVGEFSAAAYAPGADAYLKDLCEIFGEYGWDWTYHAFRESTCWSLEHEGESFHELKPAKEKTPRAKVIEKFLKKTRPQHVKNVPHFRRVMFCGNSLMCHGPNAGIGWTNNWGMAASRPDWPDGYGIDRRAVERDGKIELTLRPCGGYCARISPAKGRRICRSSRSISTRRSTTSSTWVDRYHYTAAGYELLASQVVKRVSAARVCSASGLEGENENK